MKMIRSVVPRLLTLLTGAMLASCAAIQLQENTFEMASTIEAIRITQLLTNIANQIDRPAAIPTGVIINTGSAQSSLGGTLAAALPSMNFSRNTRSLNPTVTTSWNDSWSLNPIADPQDLQNLRALYGLLYRTDDEIAGFIYETIQSHRDQDPTFSPTPDQCGVSSDPNNMHITDHKKAMAAYFSALQALPYPASPSNDPDQPPKDKKLPGAADAKPSPKDCFDIQPSESETAASQAPAAVTVVAAPRPGAAAPAIVATPVIQPATTAPQKVVTTADNKSQTGAAATLNVTYGLLYPTRPRVHDELRYGTSVECRHYQITHLPKGSPELFARWLYWKDAHGALYPPLPKGMTQADLASLGTYGGHEFWTPASACVSDFMILAISSTANSHSAAQASPKPGASQ